MIICKKRVLRPAENRQNSFFLLPYHIPEYFIYHLPTTVSNEGKIEVGNINYLCVDWTNKRRLEQ